jgi:ankyrin repeat protein
MMPQDNENKFAVASSNIESLIIEMTEEYVNEFIEIDWGYDLYVFKLHNNEKLHQIFNLIVSLFKIEGVFFPIKQDSFFEKLLLLVMALKHEALALALIEKGVGLDMEDGLAHTPLYWAVINKQPDIMLSLIEHGASIDVKKIDIATVESLFSLSSRDRVLQAIDKRNEKERAKQMRGSSNVTFFEPKDVRDDSEGSEMEEGADNIIKI